uniref:Chemokine interleukin-8-like domain-containing protein n=1 Tax=Anabas testudineus TaxID=64144 RepID=A0A7N6ALB1_ANATE
MRAFLGDMVVLTFIFITDVAADFIHGTCCFDFSTVRIRKKHMIKITKTHSDCPTRGFIVEAKGGIKSCYRDTFRWRQNPYNEQQG